MERFKNFEAVIFDMDWVIIDSEKYWEIYEKDFLEKYIIDDREDIKQDILQQCLWLSTFSIYNLIWKYYPEQFKNINKQDFIKDYIKFGLENIYNRANLIPGLINLLNNLSKQNKKVALASSSPMIWVKETLKRHNIEKYFELILSWDCVKNAKPDPEIYLKASSKFWIRPEKCLVIEDSKNWTIAGKSAGMTVYWLRNWFNDKQDLSESDFILEGF